MSTNLHVMGNRIRTARQFRRLTGEQLAEKLGISVTSLRHIENGIRRPSYQLLDEMSDILDVSMDYLAGKTEAPLERRIRKELEGSGLTQAQEDAVVEIALNSVPIIKRLGCVLDPPKKSRGDYFFFICGFYFDLTQSKLNTTA